MRDLTPAHGFSQADERALRAAALAEWDHDGNPDEGREAYADALLTSAATGYVSGAQK